MQLLTQLLTDSAAGLARIGGEGELYVFDTATRPAEVSPPALSNLSYPFLNHDVASLYRFFVDNVRGDDRFSYSTFVVLDARTVQDKTVLLVGDAMEDDQEFATLRADFYACLYGLVPMEVGTVGMEEEETDANGVLSREVVERHMASTGGIDSE